MGEYVHGLFRRKDQSEKQKTGRTGKENESKEEIIYLEEDLIPFINGSPKNTIKAISTPTLKKTL